MRTLNSPGKSSAKSKRTGTATLDASPLEDRSPWPSPLTGELLDRRVRRILEMTDSGKTFTIRDVAAEFNLSPSYLRRLFKHQTGFGMAEWLSERRLQRAAQLLANSYMSVKEIAYSVEYEHVSSFIRAFERRFGRPPARYRKQSERVNC